MISHWKYIQKNYVLRIFNNKPTVSLSVDRIGKFCNLKINYLKKYKFPI